MTCIIAIFFITLPLKCLSGELTCVRKYKKIKKFFFFLVFCSLNRNFAAKFRVLHKK